MINVLFAAISERWEAYEAPLQSAFARAGLVVELRQEHPPEAVDFIIYAPNSSVQDFRPYTRCKAVLNLWAGVEQVVGNPTLTQPLARMVDHGLTQGMVEWVTGHVLRHHLGIDAHIAGQDGIWRDGAMPPLAPDRPVGILGAGVLGLASARALAGLGFPVACWSRSEKALDDIPHFFGEDGLRELLQQTAILVLLLPQTPQTRHILNDETLGLLPQSAVIINPGRGPLIDDEALLRALDTGHIAFATLDVFDVEPLPPEHPYWAHPRVTVTPHIASATRPETAAECIAQNIRAIMDGKPLMHRVDLSRAY